MAYVLILYCCVWKKMNIFWIELRLNPVLFRLFEFRTCIMSLATMHSIRSDKFDGEDSQLHFQIKCNWFYVHYMNLTTFHSNSIEFDRNFHCIEKKYIKTKNRSMKLNVCVYLFIYYVKRAMFANCSMK